MSVNAARRVRIASWCRPAWARREPLRDSPARSSHCSSSASAFWFWPLCAAMRAASAEAARMAPSPVSDESSTL